MDACTVLLIAALSLLLARITGQVNLLLKCRNFVPACDAARPDWLHTKKEPHETYIDSHTAICAMPGLPHHPKGLNTPCICEVFPYR
eukprot:6174681-Pleurochrysis_carterae.AAC.4